MIEKLLRPTRIQTASHIDNYQEAIRRATQPLIAEKIVDAAYVDDMLAAIDMYGPYMVLAPGFALPHASSSTHTHAAGMSLLITREPVDLKGKPVTAFLVLATADSKSHLCALKQLAGILMDEDNRVAITRGDMQKIFALFQIKGDFNA